MRDRAGPDAFRPKPVFSGYGHVVTEADRALWQRWVDARAQDAYRRGVEASGAGDRDAALFWLGRAARMARENPNVVFALGMAYFSAEQWDRAIASLDWLIARFDLREAYVAAVVARLRLGRLDDAVESLGRMLGRFAPSGDFPSWVGQLAAYGTFPGWCAADNNGSVKGEALGPVAIMLDGCVVAHDVALPFALPAVWRGARVLRVTGRGKDLLGSPVALDRVRRCEGFVRIDGDRVHGWIWYPADPEFVPEVTLDDGVHVETQRAEEYAVDVRHDVPLARARVFSFRLAPGPDRDLLVRDGFGQALSGSPLRSALGELMAGASARALPEDLRPRRVPPVRRVRPNVQARPPGWLVVIPVFRDANQTLACLRSVLAASDDAEILVVDDATPEPRLARALDRLAGAGRITLVRNGRNLGFPASANRGFACAGGRDTVLLNSDTLVAPGWLARLRNVLDGDAETGTATPFSNDASIFSYPSVTRPNDVPDLKTTRRLDALCARTFDGVPPVDVPTTHGFCMAIRGDCLSQTGGMRSDVFAQGYGEENDFCLRASALGWRHVAANTVFVAHVGSASFGGMRAPLMARNLEILNALYPGYDAMIERFVASDPLAPRRRALGLARLAAGRRKRRTMLLIAHDGGGGVERVVRMRREMFVEEGWNVLVLRPDSAGCHLEPNAGDRSNLLFALPEEKDTLLEVLRACDVRAVEWHHLTGHAPLIRDLASLLAVPYDVFLHDYMWFCPRITLVGVSGGYCGEPSEAVCVRCVSEAGSRLGEALTVSGLRSRSRIELSGARRLVAPSHDTARRMQRHFEALSIEVMPWEDDATFRVQMSPRSRSRRRVCLAGALGHDKGYDVLLELARDARARRLPLDFVLVGHTPDDDALVATGHVYVTGEYRENEAAGLVRDAKADLGFIASIWPETWCFALGVLWGGGLPVVCFDLGAPAERIRKTAQGWTVPLSMPIERLNEIFLRL